MISLVDAALVRRTEEQLAALKGVPRAEAAKRRGPEEMAKIHEQIRQLKTEGCTYNDIAAELGCSRSVVHRVLGPAR